MERRQRGERKKHRKRQRKKGRRRKEGFQVFEKYCMCSYCGAGEREWTQNLKAGASLVA